MNVDPGFNYIEKFPGPVQWYMHQTKDFMSKISFILKNENEKIVSFNGQRITFPKSIKNF